MAICAQQQVNMNAIVTIPAMDPIDQLVVTNGWARKEGKKAGDGTRSLGRDS